MITSRPGESWTTSRALPSERSCVRLAMSALGIRLPIRLVEQHEDEGGARAWRDGRRASRLGLHERGAAGGAESRAGGGGRPAARAARPPAGRREPPPALRAERQQGAGVTAAERAGDRVARGRRPRRGGPPHPRPPPPRPPWAPRPASRRRRGPQSPGLAHRLPAVHAELRTGVVIAAAVSAGGHRRTCSTGPISYGLPIHSAIDGSKAAMLGCAPVRSLGVLPLRLLVALALFAGRSEAQVDPSGPWRTLHTPHFRIHFRPAYRNVALTEARERSEERRVGKECRSRWSPYH